MKVYKLLIILFLVFVTSSPVIAAEEPSKRWDNLIEISYKFTWYPQKDLRELLAKKSDEYGQSLEEYQNLLKAEVTEESTTAAVISPAAFVSAQTKPWKLHYRLAISQFCSYLVNDDKTYLENAMSALSVISGKRELSNVSFYHYLFQAYTDLDNKDRDAFVKSAFQLWHKVILPIEANNLLADSNIYKSEFEKDLPYLYENIVHLIINKAIIEKQLPDLSPLTVIVMSLKDNLSIDNGYGSFIKAIGERLQGLKSDNHNLNFAVAFVEASANQYEFEDEKSEHLIVDKYNYVRISYDASLSWADTRKGKAAILTQYMGFHNYIIRRLIDKDNLLTTNPVFLTTVGEANGLVDQSITLYGQLAGTSVRENGFVREGFQKRRNYIKAMHQLWDSSAKLLMTLSLYYKTNQQPDAPAYESIAGGPLLKYLKLFDRYAQKDTEIVPDNAYFLAAYAASQLSGLYSKTAKYSTSIESNNWAFTYQLQAFELFPFDILGILRLAHQTSREGRHRLYLQYVVPTASRLRDSRVAKIWMEKNPTEYRDTLAIVTNLIPNIVDNAFLYIEALQHAEGSQTEKDLYIKLIIMNELYMTLKAKNLEKEIPDAFVSIVKLDISENNSPTNASFDATLPPDFQNIVKTIPEIADKCHISCLKNKLYASTDDKMHTFLRELYFEDPVKTYQSLLGFHKNRN